MMTELKPCPFCGAPAFYEYDREIDGHFIKCSRSLIDNDGEYCKASPLVNAPTEKEVAAIWNCRALSRPSAEAVREACKEAIRKHLDNCTHPDCEHERKRKRYSSCAGGHLAKSAVKMLDKLDLSTINAATEEPRGKVGGGGPGLFSRLSAAKQLQDYLNGELTSRKPSAKQRTRRRSV